MNKEISLDMERYNDLVGKIEKLPQGDEWARLRDIADKIKRELIAASVAEEKGKNWQRHIDWAQQLFSKI